jgi:hypothetical protein
MVADLELGHTRADRLDHAGAVGHGNAPHMRVLPARDDAIIMIV